LMTACGSSAPQALTASNAWARFTPQNAAVYVTLSNTTSDADALVSASVPGTVADAAEIHQTTSQDDRLGMKVSPVIDLPASFTLTMKPGGYHVMLTGLHGSPIVGSTFPLTLLFKHHAPITVDAEVRA